LLRETQTDDVSDQIVAETVLRDLRLAAHRDRARSIPDVVLLRILCLHLFGRGHFLELLDGARPRRQRLHRPLRREQHLFVLRFPPFSYFGAILWFPQLFSILSFEVLDQFRVYEDYLEGKLSRSFIACYSAATGYECLSFVAFLQITATSPTENVTVHTVPFFMTIYALWTLSFKRVCHMFSKRSDAFWHSNRCYKRVAVLYVAVMLLCVIGKSAFLWPNFFGAKLFEIEGLRWTPRFMKYTVYLWMFLVVVAPILNYWVIIDRMHTITLVLNETPLGRKTKGLGLIETPKSKEQQDIDRVNDAMDGRLQ